MSPSLVHTVVDVQICAGVDALSIIWWYLRLSGELVLRLFGTYSDGSWCDLKMYLRRVAQCLTCPDVAEL
jgi:hypothetical protein